MSTASMIKYASPTGEGQIALGFGHRDGEVVLMVSDDGVVSPPPARTWALASWNAFTRQLGGRLAKATGERFDIHGAIAERGRRTDMRGQGHQLALFSATHHGPNNMPVMHGHHG